VELHLLLNHCKIIYAAEPMTCKTNTGWEGADLTGATDASEFQLLITAN
jgi:hypothetical protein